MTNKLKIMKDAVAQFVQQKQLVLFGGFGGHDTFSVATEIIRQKKRHLIGTRAAGSILFDMMLGAGCLDEMITSHTWGSIGPLPAWNLRRAFEQNIPHKVIYNEQTVFSLTMSYLAGALNIPFIPIHNLEGLDVFKKPAGLKKYATLDCPFSGEKTCVIPAIQPDVGFLKVQRCDEEGNAQFWGMLGDSKYGINACKKIIICPEEIVKPAVICECPDRTIVPGFKVDAVIIDDEWGAHPSNVQGYYYRDLDWYVTYCNEAKTIEGFERFMEKWVYSVENRQEYLKVLGESRVGSLKAKPLIQGEVNYGF